ncbi:c-type cytochrome [Sphingobacterium humi]|nr:c-type cytochrome [Sphingobacterium humi]
MENHTNSTHKLLAEVKRLSAMAKVMGLLFVLLILFTFLFPFINSGFSHAKSANDPTKAADSSAASFLQHVDDFTLAPYPDTEEGKMAAYGEQLIKETYKYLGPDNKANAVYTGNRLACGSCHLNAGTKAYAAPYVGLSAVFPIFSGREGKVATLEERINGCFERSMNGKKLPVDSKEMLAMISYIKHISKDVKIGSRIEGQGFVKFKAPDRKADLNQGAIVFRKQCVSCHQENGLGLAKVANNPAEGYVYPPLWGADSFNDGAGMARVLTAAKFIKGNMPLGISPQEPVLSDEEAFDVAAYINSFERPEKPHKDKDYPDLALKPKDAAYPPFADNLSLTQHKYGPFNF